MKKYTREEIINKLAENVSVAKIDYGTWKVSSYIGDSREPLVKCSYISHDEEDSTGIFDGAEYNTYANSNEARKECENEGADYADWFEAVTADHANEDNYEPADQRNSRLASRLLGELTDEEHVVVDSGDNYIYILDTDAERQVFDDNMNYWIFGAVKWCDKIDEFIADVKNVEEE